MFELELEMLKVSVENMCLNLNNCWKSSWL